MLFTEAKLILPEQIVEDGWLLVRGGRIAALGQGRPPPQDEEMRRLGGNYLAPGFIDVHIHGGAGRDAMEASADAFRAICQFHAGGGTTSLLLTSMTAAKSAILKMLDAAQEYRRDQTGDAAQVLGVHLEGPWLSPEQPGAQNAAKMRLPDPDELADYIQRKNLIRLLTIAPELPGAGDLIGMAVGAGIVMSAGHTNAGAPEMDAAHRLGLRHATHTFNCMSRAEKRGLFREAGALEFVLSEPDVLCELIADGFHVRPALMRLMARAKGADGICLVTDATAGAGLDHGAKFRLGETTCEVREGVALTPDHKALAGSVATMNRLVKTVVEHHIFELPQAVRMASLTPARVLRMENERGQLKTGLRADFTILNDNLEVQQTFVAGKSVLA